MVISLIPAGKGRFTALGGRWELGSIGAGGALPAWCRPREGGDPHRSWIPASAGMTRRGRAAPALQAKYAKTISPAEDAASESLRVSRPAQPLLTEGAGRETELGVTSVNSIAGSAAAAAGPK